MNSFPVALRTDGLSRQTTFGWVLSGLPSLMLLADAIGKLVKPQPVVQATLELGYPESTLTGLGLVLLGSTLLFVMPRTAFIGALLLTAYLGGAVATHVRLAHPLFSHVLFPVYLGIALWGGYICAMSRCTDSFTVATKIFYLRHVIPSLSYQHRNENRQITGRFLSA